MTIVHLVRAALRLVLLAIALAVTACSSLDATVQPPGGPSAPQQIGSGAITVALVAHDSAGDLADGDPGSVVRAAQLAADIVGKAPIRLLLRSYDGSKTGLAGVVAALRDADVKLVIAPDNEAAAVLAGALGQKGATVISLGTTVAPKLHLFSFETAGETEASLAVDEMRRRGYRSIAMVSNPNGQGRVFASQLATAAIAANIAVVAVDGSDSAAAAVAIAALPAAGRTPSAIMFIERPSAAMPVVQKLRAVAGFAATPVIGIAAWSSDPRAASSFGPGWYLAPEGNTLAQFSDRYRAAYSLPPAPEAALAYDLVVLAAALPQLLPGQPPYSPEVLTNDQGFVGVSGKFWFTPDGQVHRSLIAVDLPAKLPK